RTARPGVDSEHPPADPGRPSRGLFRPRRGEADNHHLPGLDRARDDLRVASVRDPRADLDPLELVLFFEDVDRLEAATSCAAADAPPRPPLPPPVLPAPLVDPAPLPDAAASPPPPLARRPPPPGPPLSVGRNRRAAFAIRRTLVTLATSIRISAVIFGRSFDS